MGEPPSPTPDDRAERQKIAAAIVESVRNDEKMPLPGLTAIAIQYKGLFFDCVKVEEFVFKLAQEITILLEARTGKGGSVIDSTKLTDRVP